MIIMIPTIVTTIAPLVESVCLSPKLHFISTTAFASLSPVVYLNRCRCWGKWEGISAKTLARCELCNRYVNNSYSYSNNNNFSRKKRAQFEVNERKTQMHRLKSNITVLPCDSICPSHRNRHRIRTLLLKGKRVRGRRQKSTLEPLVQALNRTD